MYLSLFHRGLACVLSLSLLSGNLHSATGVKVTRHPSAEFTSQALSHAAHGMVHWILTKRADWRAWRSAEISQEIEDKPGQDVARLIFPASARIVETGVLTDKLSLFPNLQVVVGIDPLYHAAASSDNGTVELGWNKEGGIFEPASFGEARSVAKTDLQFTAPIPVYEQRRPVGHRQMRIQYVQGFYQQVESWSSEDGRRNVVLIQSPGWGGELELEEPDFLPTILEAMPVGDYLLVTEAEPPVSLLPPAAIGLEEVVVDLPQGYTVGAVSLRVHGGYVLYRKTASLSRDELRQRIQRDQDLCEHLGLMRTTWSPPEGSRPGSLNGYGLVLSSNDRSRIQHRLALLDQQSPVGPYEPALTDRFQKLQISDRTSVIMRRVLSLFGVLVLLVILQGCIHHRPVNGGIPQLPSPAKAQELLKNVTPSDIQWIEEMEWEYFPQLKPYGKIPGDLVLSLLRLTPEPSARVLLTHLEQLYRQGKSLQMIRDLERLIDLVDPRAVDVWKNKRKNQRLMEQWRRNTAAPVPEKPGPLIPRPEKQSPSPAKPSPKATWPVWVTMLQAGLLAAVYARSDREPTRQGRRITLTSNSPEHARDAFERIIGTGNLDKVREFLGLRSSDEIIALGSIQDLEDSTGLVYTLRFARGLEENEVKFFAKRGLLADLKGEASRTNQAAKLNRGVPALVLTGKKSPMLLNRQVSGTDLCEMDLTDQETMLRATRDVASALGDLHHMGMIHRGLLTLKPSNGKEILAIAHERLFWDPSRRMVMFLGFEDSSMGASAHGRESLKQAFLKAWISFLIEAQDLAEDSPQISILIRQFEEEYELAAHGPPKEDPSSARKKNTESVIEAIGRGIGPVAMAGAGLSIKTVNSRMERARQVLREKSGETIPSNHHALVYWLHAGRWVSAPPAALVRKLEVVRAKLNPAPKRVWDQATTLPISRRDVAERLELSEKTVDIEIGIINKAIDGLKLSESFSEYQVDFWLAATLVHVYGHAHAFDSLEFQTLAKTWPVEFVESVMVFLEDPEFAALGVHIRQKPAEIQLIISGPAHIPDEFVVMLRPTNNGGHVRYVINCSYRKGAEPRPVDGTRRETLELKQVPVLAEDLVRLIKDNSRWRQWKSHIEGPAAPGTPAPLLAAG